uniref:ShKT domain-containing protein n=1 Tax=Angiostrongylus cantonensis TaxID=6313 RepID=A0A158P5S9_ANGCA
MLLFPAWPLMFRFVIAFIDCVDKSPYCSTNDCTVRPGYALEYCRKTCGNCERVKSNRRTSLSVANLFPKTVTGVSSNTSQQQRTTISVIPAGDHEEDLYSSHRIPSLNRPQPNEVEHYSDFFGAMPELPRSSLGRDDKFEPYGYVSGVRSGVKVSHLNHVFPLHPIEIGQQPIAQYSSHPIPIGGELDVLGESPTALADLITLLGCRDKDPSTCSKITVESCLSRPGFYLKLCPVKCRNCNGLQCLDSVKINCAEVRELDGCKLPAAVEYCPKTCQLCSLPIALSESLPPCKDVVETCEDLAESGMCEHPYRWAFSGAINSMVGCGPFVTETCHPLWTVESAAVEGHLVRLGGRFFCNEYSANSLVSTHRLQVSIQETAIKYHIIISRKEIFCVPRTISLLVIFYFQK